VYYRKGEVKMKLRDWEISEMNIRKIDPSSQKVEELTASIKKQGLISKIIIRKKEERFEVIAGQRRYYALLELHGEDYEVPEDEYLIKEVDDKEALMISVAENQYRLDLSPMELNRAALKLNQICGLKEAQIAKILNITPHRLKRITQLSTDQNKMTPEIREELNKPEGEGKFNDLHWDKMRDVEDQDVVKDVYKQIVEKELPPRDVPQIVNAVQKAKKAEEAATTSYTASDDTPSDGAPEDVGGPIVYSHKGDLVLIEEKGKMKFQVIGKGEDSEVPVDQYLEYLRHPDKFKCKVKLELKFIPIE